MASWNTLPAEIRLQFFECIAHSKPRHSPQRKKLSRVKRSRGCPEPPVRVPFLASLAAVNREFQDYFEAINFSRLTLNLDAENWEQLRLIVETRREHLVRHIVVWRVEDTMTPIGPGLDLLFFHLKRWNPSTRHPGLTLELYDTKTPSDHLSQPQKWGRLPAAPIVTSLILPRQRNPWMDNNNLRYLLAALPRLESFRWEPWADTLRTRYPSHINRYDGDKTLFLTTRDLSWRRRPWRMREAPHQIALAFLQSLSPTVKSVSIYSDELRLDLMHTLHSHPPDMEPNQWLEESSHWFTEALFMRTTQLSHLSACYIIDANKFLNVALSGPSVLKESPKSWKEYFYYYQHGKRPHYSDWKETASFKYGKLPSPFPPTSSSIWDHLETLTLTSKLLSPVENDNEINDMFLRAGQVAQRMPKLKTLEIWNGTNPTSFNSKDNRRHGPASWRDGFGFIFCYRTSPPPSSTPSSTNGARTTYWGSNWASRFEDPGGSYALLEFKSSWKFTPYMDVLEIWEQLAKSRRKCLKTTFEYIPDGFNTGVAVMKELATRELVIADRSWDDIQQSKRTGPIRHPVLG